MTWDNAKYVKLLLQRSERGRDKYLIALRTTADFYGWTNEFPVWRPPIVRYEDGVPLVADPGRRGEMFCEPGHRLRISRSPSRSSYPAGLTNSFKVSRNCGLKDLAEVAHFTSGSWCWMSSPRGRRRTRSQWDEIYQAGTYSDRRTLQPLRLA